MAGKKQTKRVVRALNDWNKPRFIEQDEFCKVSLKVNKIKVNEFANVLTEDIFRPLATMLGKNRSVHWQHWQPAKKNWVR